MNAGEYNEPGREQIGQLLEKKRREKGLSLKDVEQATKIRTRYLEGLEREDYSMLPDQIYARGFLKTYADFLGLDGNQLSRELREHRAPRRERQSGYERLVTSEFDQPLIDPGGLRDAEGHRVSGATILSIIIAVLVLAVVIGALYYIGSRSVGDGAEETPKEKPAEQEQQEEEAAAPSLVQEKESNEAPNASGSSEYSGKSSAGSNATETVQVTVKVLDDPAGLTILKDGTVAADVFAQPGFSQTFEAKTTVTVSTTDAGAVEIEANGQNTGRLGSYGQPVTRDFTPTSKSSWGA